MATTFTSQRHQGEEDPFPAYTNSLISPTSALFPPGMSSPSHHNNNNQHLSATYNPQMHRSSLSSSSSSYQPYLSRPPSLSLSPSSQSADVSNTNGHSPHSPSSASPSSAFSLPNSDDHLQVNSFSQHDLDILFYQPEDPPKSAGNEHYIPQFDTLEQSLLAQSQQRQGQQDTMNVFNFGGDSAGFNFGGFEDRRYSVVSNQSTGMFDGNIAIAQNGDRRFSSASNVSYGNGGGVGMGGMGMAVPVLPQQPIHQQQQAQSQTIQPNWMNLGQNQVQQGQRGGWDEKRAIQEYLAQTQQASSTQPPPLDRNTITKPPTQPLQTVPIPRPITGRKPKPSTSICPPSAPVPIPGKHNKTERRYRQKVAAAQDDLRDSVPVLRYQYNTSTDFQKATTDYKADDGTVDGLPELGRPNASAKTTIFIGARMYIELLSRRIERKEREVKELEGFRRLVGGEDDLEGWRRDFERREGVIEMERLEREGAKAEEGDSEDEESEEDERPKKRGRKKGVGNKKEKEGPGVRAFAAFAMTFSMLPSAGTVFRSGGGKRVVGLGHVFTGEASTGEVLRRLPVITAEHAERMMRRTLPGVMVPDAGSIVDWTWRVIVGVLFAYLVGLVFRRKKEGDRVGSFTGMSKDMVRAAVGRKSGGQEWNGYAASIIGDSVRPSALVRFHVGLNLATDNSYSLALLALLQPTVSLITPSKAWAKARSLLTPTSSHSLRTVLALNLSQALDTLTHLPVTTSPIEALSEQINLIHIHDLYTRLFILFVKSSTIGPSHPNTTKSLLSNLDSSNISSQLKSMAFDKEIQHVVKGVPKGSAAHALGLVLIGLWGLFTGVSGDAQAILVSALAAEEEGGLKSVSSMLDLLYPGLSTRQRGLKVLLPKNAISIDRLAEVCIHYVRLLSVSGRVKDQEGLSRRQRAGHSRFVSGESSRLRGVLVGTEFQGVGSESEKGESGVGFEEAREKLVGVLCGIARRAAGRAEGRDEDSGLDGDLDEI